jgi:hypothetical protein
MLRALKGLLYTGVFCGLTLAGINHAQANIIPTLDSISSDAAGWRWTYDAVLHEDARVEDGDYFTIYDFRGFVPGTNTQPAGWDFVANNVGLTPPNVLPSDSAGIVNLTWVRSGGTTAEADLGQFSAVSTLNQIVLDHFTSRTTKNVGGDHPEDGTVLQNIGFVAVPIPLPAAMLMFPLGAAVAGFCYRRMRR